MKSKILFVTAAIAATAFGCAHKSDVTETAQTQTAQRDLASENTVDCVREAKADGCFFWSSDERDADKYAAECRSIESKSGATKVILFRMQNGDIVAVTSRDPKRAKYPKPGHDECRVKRFITGKYDPSDRTKDIAARDNKFFFLTNSGHVYLGTINSQSDLDFEEILSKNGNAYKGEKFSEEKSNYHKNKRGEWVPKVDVQFSHDGTSTSLNDDELAKHKTVPAKADVVESYKSGASYGSIFENRKR